MTLKKIFACQFENTFRPDRCDALNNSKIAGFVMNLFSARKLYSRRVCYPCAASLPLYLPAHRSPGPSRRA
ncbi:MAG: hypothetical protein ACRYGK_18600 [Janthinobacterium lividum]